MMFVSQSLMEPSPPAETSWFWFVSDHATSNTPSRVSKLDGRKQWVPDRCQSGWRMKLTAEVYKGWMSSLLVDSDPLARSVLKHIHTPVADESKVG